MAYEEGQPARTNARQLSGSTYQRLALTPELNAIIDSTVKDKALGAGEWYKNIPGHEVLDKTYETPEQAKAAVAEWGKTIDPDLLKKSSSDAYAQREKDWTDGQHDNSFFGMNPDTLAAGMALVAGGSMAMGGWAAAPASGAATGGNAALAATHSAAGYGATAANASGLAGMVGMDAGIGATALNTGTLNAGITALRGGSLEDSLKSGLTAAALSPVGGWAKGVVGEATAGLGKGISSAIASTAAGAATGAAGAALTGKDVGKGATTGLIAGGIQSFGNAVGGWAKEASGSDVVGTLASAGTKAVLGKKQNNLSLLGSMVDGGIEAFGKRTKSGVTLSDGTAV